MSGEAEKVVRVLYDYNYNEDAHQVEIKAGDIYRLLEMTNSEWWHVYDPTQSEKESFFVPAQYVSIVSEDSPWKTLSDLDKLLTINDDPESTQDSEATDSSMPSKNSSNVELRAQSDGSQNSIYANSSVVSASDDGEYVNLDQFRDAVGLPRMVAKDASESSEGDSKSDEVPAELIQGSVPPPLPEEGTFVKVLLKDSPWDIYKENKLGRLYYVNRDTQERMWKPPRKPVTPVEQLKPSPPSELPQSSLATSVSPTQTKDEGSIITPDYDQVLEGGNVYYIQKATRSKWKAVVDKLGRQYFHRVGSTDTLWALPASSSDGNAAKVGESVSDSGQSSVQIIPVLRSKDVTWETQSHRLSTFGGQGLRSERAKSTYGHIETTPGISSSRASTLPANFPGLIATSTSSGRSTSPSAGSGLNKPTGLQLPSPNGSLVQLPVVETAERPQSFQPLFMSNNLYEGMLYKTKLMDSNKKKVKKSWTQVYVVLQGSNLVFYKDQKSAAQKQGSPHGRTEGVVSLQGAHVTLNPKELTSKKNTFSLRTNAGVVYLFQSDTEKESKEWFTHMKIVANDLSPADISPRGFDLQETKKDDKKSEKSITRSVSSDEGAILHAVDRNKNLVGIRAKLLNLISRRPTQEDLYKRGIIKDAVFGSKLPELCEREKVNVPNFVQKCIAAVETKGLTHDGLYRISGNMAEIQRLRCTVDTDDSYNLCDDQWDIHVLTGSLKLFFRELKEPVFPFNMFDKFLEAIKKDLRKDKLSAFKSLVASLPKCNYSTLKVLFQHLCKVVAASQANRMQTQNVAIVFGPTLLWQPTPVENLAVQTVYQSRIVEFILLEYGELFK